MKSLITTSVLYSFFNFQHLSLFPLTYDLTFISTVLVCFGSSKGLPKNNGVVGSSSIDLAMFSR